MAEREYYIDSTDQQDRLRVISWMPDTGQDPELIVLFVHGMAEYIDRYREFALFLCEKGIGAAGHDHLGHGKSVTTAAHLGYFTEKDGDRCLVDDAEAVRAFFAERHPGSRFIMLGHSMGSFVTREYLREYGKNLAGAILMGTGEPGTAAAVFGQSLATAFRVARGKFYRSKMMNNLVLDSNYRYFTSEKAKSWLTTDDAEARKYQDDKLCGFSFTAGAYQDFFRLIRKISAKNEAAAVPKGLPVLFISGEDDPVGNFGKGVRKVFQKYKDAGHKQVSLRLFRGMRHEILHETNRALVFDELLEWIQKR